MNGTVRLMVTVTVDGGYYIDTDDLAGDLNGFIRAAIHGQGDDIDAYGPNVDIERIEVPQP